MTRRLAALLLTAAMLLWSAAPLAPAAGAAVSPMAAGTFTGGPDQAPLFVLNDHTPIAVHFTASGLATSTAYYAKVRFTVGTTPSGSTNRGWTWNPTTQQWAQERGPWTDCPQISTDASGHISSGAGWMYAAFGDENAAGSFHIMISLSQTGSGSTYNSSIVPTVTVLDVKSAGTRVHNGIATGAQAAKKAQLSQDTSLGVVYSLQKTEANGLDDDFNGVVDDEDYGLAGKTGDFRFGAPATTPVKVNLNNVDWAPSVGFVTGPPDVDLAIGATDTQEPTPPTALAAEPKAKGAVSLTWDPATDNVGVAEYRVYRWIPSADGTQFTVPHVRIATVSGTSYEDTDTADGTTYAYEVRAMDAATNESARSAAATAAADASGPAAVADLSALPDAGAATATVTWTVPADAAEYQLRYVEGSTIDTAAFDGATTVTVGPPSAAGTTETATVGGLTKGRTYAFALRSRDALGNWSDLSNIATVTPRGAGSVGGLLWGADRYETAIKASKSAFATGSVDTVVLATGHDFADALSASALCGSYGSPLLLSRGTPDPRVRDEIQRLGAHNVIILGGMPSVPQAVEDDLEHAGLTVERMNGKNRYDTAAMIAKRVHDRGGSTKAFFVRGDEYPDGLSVAPFASNEKMPVLLVKTDRIPPETSQAIADDGITGGVVAGDGSAVATSTYNTLAGMLSGSLVRRSGGDRYGTAAAIADFCVGQGWGGFGYVGVALGTSFPDALGGGVAAGAHGGVLLLSKPASLPDPIAALLTAHRLEVEDVEPYGGTLAQSAAIRGAVKGILK